MHNLKVFQIKYLLNFRMWLLGIPIVLLSCNSKKQVHTSIGKGQVITIESKQLRENREIYVYIPESANFSKTELPVLYILDAEDYFDPVTDMIELFSKGNKKGSLPLMAVIGIPNTNRDRDLTPTRDLHASLSASVPLNDNDFKNTGGAGNFTLFIQNELIPYINTNFHLSGKRILIGHSFGGLMAVNTLLNYEGVFEGYLTIDPSTWWDQREMTKQAVASVAVKDFKDIAFFYANSYYNRYLSYSLKKNDPKDPYLNEINFGRIFTSQAPNMPFFSWIRYESEWHESVPLIAIYDGLQEINKFFNTKIQTDSMVHQESGALRLLYDELDELSINSGKYIRDSNYYKSYTDSVHSSANLFRLMGDMFLTKGDSLSALKNYEKSIIHNPKNFPVAAKVNHLKTKLNK